MARIQYGAIITDIKGSIGGLSFQKNNASKIVRTKPRQVTSGTPKRFDSTSKFSEIISAFAGLSLSQQTAWNNYAIAHPKVNFWNETKQLNGFNFFLSINSTKAMIGSSIILDPPVYVLPAPAPSFYIELTPTSIIFRFSSSWSSPGMIYFYLSPPLRTASLFNRKALRFAATSAYFSSNSYTITSKFPDVAGYPWPPPLSSNKIYLLGAVTTMNSIAMIQTRATLGNGQFTP